MSLLVRSSIALLLSVLFSSPVFAATFTYQLAMSGAPAGQASVMAACVTAYAYAPAGFKNSVTNIKKANSAGTEYSCDIESINPSDGGKLVQSRSVTRQGDSCEAGQTNDEEVGRCFEPKECKEGELFPARGTAAAIVTSGGKNYTYSKPSQMCYDGCTFAAGDDARPVSCYKTAGAATGYCNYVTKGTGVPCSTENFDIAVSGEALNPSDTPEVPSSDPNDPLCPKGWTNNNGTCFKNPVVPCNPATTVCGPSTPGGTPGTGGGSTGGGGDGGGGGGGGGGASAGASTDLGTGTGTGSGTASAGEECKPKADGSGCGGPVVKNEDCDKVMACSGDAIQCAILRKQKQAVCDSQYSAEAQKFVEAQIAKDDYKVLEHEVDGASLFNDGRNAGRWLPASCPAPKSIPLHGVSASLSFQPACDFASAMGPLFVALAGIFWAVYVGRAFGGS